MLFLMLICINKTMIIKSANMVIGSKINVTLIIPNKVRKTIDRRQKNIEKRRAIGVEKGDIIDSVRGTNMPPFDIISVKWGEKTAEVRLKLDNISPVSSQMYLRNKQGKMLPISSLFTFIPQSKILHFIIPYKGIHSDNIIMEIQANGGEINILKGE